VLLKMSLVVLGFSDFLVYFLVAVVIYQFLRRVFRSSPHPPRIIPTRLLEEAKAVGRVAAINIYPIKSCRGVSLNSATIGAYGFEHDREFCLVRVEVIGVCVCVT
jgi:hypothetical protein